MPQKVENIPIIRHHAEYSQLIVRWLHIQCPTDDQFAAFAKDIGNKSEIEKRAFIGLLCANKEKRERWKTWKKKKPEIAQVVESVRANLNLPPLP